MLPSCLSEPLKADSVDMEKFLQRQNVYECTKQMRLQACQYWEEKSRRILSHPKVCPGTRKLDQKGMLRSFQDRYESDMQRRRREEQWRQAIGSPNVKGVSQESPLSFAYPDLTFQPQISNKAKRRAGVHNCKNGASLSTIVNV